MPKKKKSKSASPKPQGEKPYTGPILEPSLYRNTLGDKAEKTYDRALKVESINQELALLRVHLNSLIAEKTKSTPLILKAIELVIRAYAAKTRASGDPSAPTEQAIDSMLRDASEKYGLKIIPWDSNC